MRYLLTHCMMNHKYARWIVILQEFDLQFNAPKRKNAPIVVEFITGLPIETQRSLINDALLDENLFLVSTDDPWYSDILLLSRNQKFKPHLTRGDQRCIRYQAPHYLLMRDVLY